MTQYNGPTIRAQTGRATVTENTSRSRWRCPNCGSEKVQISLPVWFREYADGELVEVEVDAEAEIRWWYCDDCDESDDGAPEEVRS